MKKRQVHSNRNDLKAYTYKPTATNLQFSSSSLIYFTELKHLMNSSWKCDFSSSPLCILMHNMVAYKFSRIRYQIRKYPI